MGLAKRKLLEDHLEFCNMMLRQMSRNYALYESLPGCEGAWEIWMEKRRTIQEWIRELDALEATQKREAGGNDAAGVNSGAIGGKGSHANSGEPQAGAVDGTWGGNGEAGGLVTEPSLRDRLQQLEVTPHQPPAGGSFPSRGSLGNFLPPSADSTSLQREASAGASIRHTTNEELAKIQGFPDKAESGEQVGMFSRPRY